MTTENASPPSQPQQTQTTALTDAPAARAAEAPVPAAQDAAPAGSLLDPPVAPTEPPTPVEEPAPAPEPLTAEALSLPEGFQPDEALMNEFLELANTHGLPAESANKLLSFHSQILQGVATQMEEQWNQTQQEWRTQVQALPEIGGANLQPALGEIAKLLNRYGGDEARQAFALTGAGNHPAVIQFLHKIAKDVNERAPVSGQPPTASPSDRAARMFRTQ